MSLTERNIEIWGWDKKPRTMLRYLKAGDIVCYEVDETGTEFRYGQLIARLTGGFAFKGLDIVHKNPDDISIEEIKQAKQFGQIFVLDVYMTLEHKQHIKNGEWRVIGREKEFTLNQYDLETTFFVFGAKGMKERKNLLNENVDISDREAEKYISSSQTSGDNAKRWYLK